ncbi:uncharacterized protein LOC141902068 [Tubulanus polymorphus]|uniref:uncharacterized protein LOC141902068 n=1 Tax=Tubulanus polymorphus TaxID=672921 RepID=UPI003DA5D69D
MGKIQSRHKVAAEAIDILASRCTSLEHIRSDSFEFLDVDVATPSYDFFRAPDDVPNEWPFEPGEKIVLQVYNSHVTAPIEGDDELHLCLVEDPPNRRFRGLIVRFVGFEGSTTELCVPREKFKYLFSQDIMYNTIPHPHADLALLLRVSLASVEDCVNDLAEDIIKIARILTDKAGLDFAVPSIQHGTYLIF